MTEVVLTYRPLDVGISTKWHSTTAGNFTMTSAKCNTIAVYHGMYCGTLLNTAVYCGTLFFVVPVLVGINPLCIC